MAKVMLEILDDFSSKWVLMYWHSKSPVLQVTVNFELKLMNISSSHSNSNFALHIVIHWSLFKVQIKHLHNNSHQRETIHDKLILFAKLVRQWKSKEWAESELEYALVIFIYSNSKFKVTWKCRLWMPVHYEDSWREIV